MKFEQFGPWMDALKVANPEAYNKAIEFSEGVTLKHELPLNIAVDVEQATVMLACHLLDITPAAGSEASHG